MFCEVGNDPRSVAVTLGRKTKHHPDAASVVTHGQVHEDCILLVDSAQVITVS
jgi:hypothetical protein